MPTIEATDRETALRLARAAETLGEDADSNIRVITAPSGADSATWFSVSEDLLEAYQQDVETQATPQAPACQSSPCFVSQCSDFATATLTALAPNTAAVGAPNTTVTLTGTDFVAPMTVNVDPPGAEPVISGIAATITSPTSATVVVPASALDAAGTVTVRVSTPYGNSNQQSITVA